MRDYNQYHEQVLKTKLKTVSCNKCGKEHETNGDFYNDEIKTNLFHELFISFGYPSKYDCESWSFDLCEDCLVNFVESFKIKPDGKDVD
jgi:hypothetical protein